MNKTPKKTRKAKAPVYCGSLLEASGMLVTSREQHMAKTERLLREAHKLLRNCAHGRPVDVHCPDCHRECIAMGADVFS